MPSEHLCRFLSAISRQLSAFSLEAVINFFRLQLLDQIRLCAPTQVSGSSLTAEG